MITGSQLDYGAPIYSQASKSPLQLLNTIQSSSLRIALGAFRTSPTLSLCAEAAEPPLEFRFLILTANFLASLAQYPDLPSYSHALDTCSPYHSSLSSHLHKPFILKPLLPIKPSTPPWLISPPNIRLDLANIPKTDNSIYRKHINNIISEFPNSIVCYTDGSKSGSKTGYAYSIQGSIVSHRLRNSASIFTAELSAIYSCLTQLTQRPPNHRYLILSDSLSSLLSLQDTHSSNPITQRIHILLHTLSSNNSTVLFIWIPGHINHPDHDIVDRAAKDSTTHPKITDPSPTPAYDLKNYYRFQILSSWHDHWSQQTNNKLRSIKNSPVPWSSANRASRQEEVALARLRIGHTRLTHSYLILRLLGPPSCHYCHFLPLTVDHFFSCPILQNMRNAHSVPSSISALHNNTESITNSIAFLRSTYFFSLL